VKKLTPDQWEQIMIGIAVLIAILSVIFLQK